MIAITGSIGTGKSTVCTIIRSMGFKIIDCDKIVHQLYLEEEILNKVKELFPSVIIKNQINRKKLGHIIFSDKEAKNKLESLIHPYVRKELEKLNDNVFVEVPLLYESHMEDIFDKVICVACDDIIQIKRVMERNKINAKDARNIINNQMDIKEKVKKADYTLYNNGDMNQLIKDTKDLVKKLTKIK